jgi:oligo-1,6-glucosidase
MNAGLPGGASITAVSGDEPWWKEAVVYQVYPRSFADSNGDGIGDLEGLRQRLDYIRALGVGAIWLSPVYQSPQHDNGYDISNYRDIDPVYGTLEQFDLLVSEIHDRGMRLVMDVVVNHTSDVHPWFVASRSSRMDPKRNWYWWRPPRLGRHAREAGAEPNNWGSFFSGSAWQFDPATDEYYLHLFSPRQPDLNWETPEVRDAVYSMMRSWLDRGVDGFRLDVINLISKDPVLPDGPVILPHAFGNGCTSFVCGPRVHEYLQEMHREVFDGRGTLLNIGEMPGVSVNEARLFTDPTRRELDMVFQFEHMELDQGVTKWNARPLRLTDLKASLGRWQEGLAKDGWNSLYWSNHDQPRAVSRFGADGIFRVRSAKLLATVLHLHRGTPFVFQGEEIGMTNAGFRGIDGVRDIESRKYYESALARGEDPATVMARIRIMGRDNARTPMHWDGSRYAGFSTVEPWIAVNPNHSYINAARDVADPSSVYHYYRSLADLRRSEPTVVRGDFTMLLPDDEQIYAYTRRYETTQLLVVANFSDQPSSAAIEGAAAWAGAELILANCERHSGDPGLFALDPWEVRVYRRQCPAR